jgi:hypothetical protein
VDRSTRLAIIGIALAVASFGHRAWQAALVAASTWVGTEGWQRLPLLLKRRQSPNVVVPITCHIAATATATTTVTGIAHGVVA